MKSSFSLEPNSCKGGECLGLYAQGFKEPDKIIGKPCKILIYEVDYKGKKVSSSESDFLAEFETAIMKSSSSDTYFFDPEKTKRVDSFDKTLPPPETQKDKKGNNLPHPLKYKPAYFDLFLDFGGNRPLKDDINTIIIQGNKGELEKFIYEIGIKVEIEGKEIFNSFKGPCYVNCCNLLCENCVHVADVIKKNHDTLVSSRNVGTYYGDKFIYSFPSEKSFLEWRSNMVHGFVDQQWVQSNTGLFWDKTEKQKFVKDKEDYGLEHTSCIDYVLDTFKTGFEKSNMSVEWEKIYNYVKQGKGMYLAEGLIKHGWVSIYYNPDVYHPNDDDDEHPYSYTIAKRDKTYGTSANPPIVPVFDFVVNYRPTPKSSKGNFTFPPKDKETTKETSQLDKLNKVPFGFIMGRGGSHTALLIKGKIYQVHWEEGPYYTDVFDIEKHFDCKDVDTRWEWISGLIVMPKLFWS